MSMEKKMSQCLGLAALPMPLSLWSIEQMNLIKQLDDDDRTVVFRIIDTMLTKKKFKDFFQKNVAAL